MTMVVEKATALELPPVTFVEDGWSCDHQNSRCVICLPQCFPEVLTLHGQLWCYPTREAVDAMLAAEATPPKALKLHRRPL